MDTSRLFVLTIVYNNKSVYQSIKFDKQAILEDFYEYCDEAVKKIKIKNYLEETAEGYHKYVCIKGNDDDDDDEQEKGYIGLKREMFLDDNGELDENTLCGFFPYMSLPVLNWYHRTPYCFSINEHELKRELKHKKLIKNDWNWIK